MSRQYNSDLDAVGYHRRHGRNIPADGLYRSRESSRTHPIGSRPIQSSSAVESESERGQNRRRIAVACSRCRKRKIKCSGDPGNGQGCVNCKTAGAEFGACQFLRVNSENYAYAVPQAQWPYHSNGLASMPSALNHAENTLDPFTMNNSYSTSSLCASSYPGTSLSVRSQPSANSSSLYPLIPHRSDSCTNLSSFPFNSYFDSVDMTNGPYTIQGHTPQASAAWYGASSDSLRQWPSSGRPSIGFDPEVPARYISSNASYGDTVLTSGISSIDPLSHFPTMRGLANSLPPPNSHRNSDRVLPNPRGSQGLPPSEINIGAHSSVPDLPSTVSWGSERVITGRSQTPVSTGSSSLSALSMIATNGRRSATPPVTQQTTFGYLEHSPPTGSTTPTTDYGSSTKTNIGSATADLTSAAMHNHLLSATTYDSGLSSDTTLRRDGSSASLYTYSSGSGSKELTRSSDGDGKLLNGQTYMPYLQLQQQKPIAYNSQRRESSDTSSHLSHRPSITSVGSSR